MTWTNLATLSARLDPHYQLKMQQLQASVQGEQYRAQSAMEREHVKANALMERERFRANESWQQMQNQANRDDQREQARGQTALDLSKQEHAQRLREMQADLENRARMAGIESNLLAVHKILDEDNNRRASLHRQLEDRSKLRGEVFKMLAGAVIQEKLAQRQHEREKELRTIDHDNRKAESYWNGVCAYLSTLLDQGKTDAAKGEIDQLLGSWQTVADGQ
jgi:hypothetical protein